MKPVLQTKLNDPEKGVRGNCMRAALASILELEIDGIPAFEDMPDGEWGVALINWLSGLGKEFHSHGPNEAPRGYSIANGDTVRGTYHSVVALNGVMVFDPHPSGAGILRVREYWEVADVDDDDVTAGA